MLGQYTAVVSGLRKQQDHHARVSIAQLQLDAALGGLDVMEARLSLDADVSRTVQKGVPRPKISTSHNGYLGAPAEPRSHVSPEPLKHSQLGSISYCGRRGIGLEIQLEAQRSSVRSGLFDRQCVAHVALGAADSRLGQTGYAGDVRLADTGSQAGLMELRGESGSQSQPVLEPSIASSFSAGHG